MKPEADIADPDLERGLLASLLADNGGFDRLGQLQPDDLFDPIHASILTAMLDLTADRRPVTLVTLRSRFAAVPFGDEGTVLDYIKRFEFAGSRPDVADIAANLRELAQRRAIQQMGEQISSSVHDHAAKPSLLLTDAARAVDDLLAKCRPAGKTLHAMPEAVQDVLSASKHGDRDARIPIGFADLDRDTGGWRRREYGLLGGRT